MNKNVVLLSFFVMIFGQINESLAYSWPVDGDPNSWSYGYTFAQVVNGERHLGVDIIKDPLIPVRAPVDCEIFISKTQINEETKEIVGYGTYIVAEYVSPTGQKRVFGIGHLSCRSGYKAKPVGKYSEGTILGYVGYDDENGLGGPHVHWFDYGEKFNGFKYPGYSPNDYNEDVDYDQNGNYIGGKFTDPVKQWSQYNITSPYTYTSHAYTGSGNVQGGENTNWNYSLPNKTTTFTIGDTAKAIVRAENVKVNHRWTAEIWREGVKLGEYSWNWADVGSGWNTSYFWPEAALTEDGNWEFRCYLEYDAKKDLIVVLPFTVAKPLNWKTYTYDDNAYTGYSPVIGGEDTDWIYTLNSRASQFNVGEDAYGLFYISDVKVDHRFKTITYHNGKYLYEYIGDWNRVSPGGWNYAHAWVRVENVDPGNWQIKLYVDDGDGFKQIDTLEFSVVGETVILPDYTYDGNGYTGYGPVFGGEHTSWVYNLNQQTSIFNSGDEVYALLYISDIRKNFRLRTVTYCNGVQQYDYIDGWNDVGSGWNRAYHWPSWSNIWAGNWEFHIYVDTGRGFQRIKILQFYVANDFVPPQKQTPSVLYEFDNHDSQGWTVGYDTKYVNQDQPDDNTWMVIAQGRNPGIVSPVLADGFFADTTPTLKFSIKARGPFRQSVGQVFIKDKNNHWGYETVFKPVLVDYNYHVYELNLFYLGHIPIRQFSIELTQDASYEQWIVDWVKLE